MNARYVLGFVILLTSLGGVVAQDKQLPPLRVTLIKAEMSYMIDGGADDGIRQQANTWGKILQVIDDDNMLVGIDNGGGSPGGNPRYSVTVWCKFPTKNLTDGKADFLGNILGADRVTVSGTTRYKTATGGTRTVMVLEPYAKPAGGEKPATPAIRKTGKTGAAAYDDFIEPVRDLLVKDWQKEIATLHRVIPEEEQSIKNAKTSKDREYHERWLATYRERLAIMERNDPPYINLETLKKK